jgi:hypothetical protein
MTLRWADLVDVVGEPEGSARFESLLALIGEPAVVWDVPPELNNSGAATRFYRFLKSGFELGIRDGRSNHIHFFIHADQEYSAYTGPMPPGVAVDQHEAAILRLFGSPAKSGGPTRSPLLGFVHRWIRYEDDPRYALRFEFTTDDELRYMSLLAR